MPVTPPGTITGNDGKLYWKNPQGQYVDPSGKVQSDSTITTPPLQAHYDWLKQQPYANSAAAKQVLDLYEANRRGSTTSENVRTEMSRYANTFDQMFQNYVGRAPNADEYDKFFNQVVVGEHPWTTPVDWTAERQDTTNLLKDYYTRTAQDTAEAKAQSQSDAAVAPGSAFDTWQKQYSSGLNDVEKSLQDYQTRLMEKIRPQLLTSLKAQGLLNTGGLNEAFAGTAGDLTAASQDYLSQARMGVNQDIANQRYQLASAPTSFKLSNTFNTVPALTTAGTTALQNLWQSDMANRYYDFQNKQAADARANQPSLLSMYGGQILGGTAAGFAGGFGSRLASPRTPTTAVV